MGGILAWAGWQLIGGLIGKLWKMFCALISTPIGAALVAGVIAFYAGSYLGANRVDTEWKAKWAKAETDAEMARILRDDKIKREMSANADARIDALKSQGDELRDKLRYYEDEDAQRKHAGDSVTDESDAQWVRDLQRSRPKARR